MMEFTMRSTALGLLLLLVTPSLCQSKVPYEQWYVNKTMYPVSRFRDPPEARGRMNPVGYRNYIAGEEEIWNGKCNVTHEAPGCIKSETAWYYNIETEQCAISPHGSCSGTKNNFKTKEQCDQECTAFSPGKAQAVPISVPDPIVQTVPATQPAPITQSVPDSQPALQPVPVIEPVPVPQPVPVIEPVPVLQPVHVPQPVVQTDPVVQTVSVPEPVPVVQPILLVATTAPEKQHIEIQSILSSGVDDVTPEKITSNTVIQVTTEKNIPILASEPALYVAPGILEIQAGQKQLQNLQNDQLTCGHQLHKLAGVYLQQHAGVPRPVSMHDNATRSAEKTIGHYIDQAAVERFDDCSKVEIGRTKWLSTEAEHTADGGMIIYQIGIQTIEFALP